jgi:hypothetical protein
VSRAGAERQGEAIRSHWGVENSHHWVMDMVFRDDECRIRKDNAPANYATIKHIASNLMRREPAKKSMRVKRRLAAWGRRLPRQPHRRRLPLLQHHPLPTQRPHLEI